MTKARKPRRKPRPFGHQGRYTPPLVLGAVRRCALCGFQGRPEAMMDHFHDVHPDEWAAVWSEPEPWETL